MNEKNFEEIFNRIEKLEKKNKYLKISNIIFAVIISAFGLLSFQSKPELPRIIEAEKFIIKDPEMGVLGFFGYSKREDKKSETTVTDVALSMNGGIINIARGSQNVNIDASRLTYTDKSQPNQKIIELLNSNEPSLEMTSFQKNNRFDNVVLNPSKIFWSAKTSKKENLAGILPKLSIGKADNINTGISLFDASGRLRAVLGSTVTKDASGKNVVTSESNFFLYDTTGAVIYKQPK